MIADHPPIVQEPPPGVLIANLLLNRPGEVHERLTCFAKVHPSQSLGRERFGNAQRPGEGPIRAVGPVAFGSVLMKQSLDRSMPKETIGW